MEGESEIILIIDQFIFLLTKISSVCIFTSFQQYVNQSVEMEVVVLGLATVHVPMAIYLQSVNVS